MTHGDDHHWCAPPPLTKAAYASKHVKCVGDSLTSGGHGGEIRSGDAGYSPVYSREKANYCSHLGVSLGAGYDVANLGLSGATVESYASSDAYASLADVVAAGWQADGRVGMAASSSFLNGDTGALFVSSATGVHAPVSLSTRYSRPVASVRFSNLLPAWKSTGWRAGIMLTGG